MKHVVEVEARGGFQVWVRFEDGTEGEVDFSDLSGEGVFRAWDDRAFFESVFVGPEGSIAWPGEIEICPDSAYLRLTGKAPEELFEQFKPTSANA